MRTYTYTDETGNRYGRLTVLCLHERGGRDIKWLCQCECGNQKVISGGNLRSGHAQSCGCLQDEVRTDPRVMRKRKRSGWGVRKPFPQFDRLVGETFSAYRASAKARKLPFHLTKDDVKNFMAMNCNYCGSPPSTYWLSPITGEEFWWNGIDRLNSNYGYVLDNCVPCCSKCNWMKSDYSVEDFVEHATKVSVHYRSGA